MWGPFLAAAAGALLMYYMDPDRGAYRRNVTRDRLAGSARRGGRTVDRTGRRVAAEAYGAGQKLKHLDADSAPENDAALAQKVMSEVFRDQDLPRGINVNAVEGVVYLRGQVKRPDEINEIESRVRDVTGVIDVENLLHLPGTPAPEPDRLSARRKRRGSSV